MSGPHGGRNVSKSPSSGSFSPSYPRRAVVAAMLALAMAVVSGASVSFAQTATPTRAAAASCSTTSQGVIVVVVENPSPGDLLVPGNNVVINGVAYDTSSTQGPGIDKVAAYLGDRDAGSIFLGNAALGLPNPLAPSSSQFANAGFSLRSLTLPVGTG